MKSLKIIKNNKELMWKMFYLILFFYNIFYNTYKKFKFFIKTKNRISFLIYLKSKSLTKRTNLIFCNKKFFMIYQKFIRKHYQKFYKIFTNKIQLFIIKNQIIFSNPLPHSLVGLNLIFLIGSISPLKILPLVFHFFKYFLKQSPRQS